MDFLIHFPLKITEEEIGELSSYHNIGTIKMQKGDEMRGKEFDWLDKQNIGDVKFEIMDIIHS